MSTPILQTYGLTKRYGSLVAVKDLTLDVYEGEVLGLLGPNGAGKTTAINMICGLLKPDAGQVLLHGRPLTNGDAAAASRVGVCPQNAVLWGRLTCLEQLEFVGEMYGLKRRLARQRGEQLLADLGLAEKTHKLASTLSGGMQRRLNLALALVHDPEIVVLDEPEAGLDPQSRIQVREYIRSLGQARTVILTTHNMDEADRLAQRIAIIDHGELLVLDTPEALKQRLGHGDVVEIALAPDPGPRPIETEGDPGRAGREEALAGAALQGLVADVHFDAGTRTLQVRALHAVGRLAAILDALQAVGLHPGEISLRANTLEDVFIQLTGRRLRE